LILPFIVVLFLWIRQFNHSKIKVREPRRGIDRSLTYPRQYPCGWYRICDSEEISNQGQVNRAFALGREMVIFRSDDEHRQIYVLNAFCIHMGANLAIGGRVIPGTNCIQCPFHLWEFSGTDGRCTKIPYLDGKIPEKVKTMIACDKKMNCSFLYRLKCKHIHVLNVMEWL
jgi:phenylpropionate dioxygenase-like ring-hydroxylating dioxygenase large terminal subunit